MVKQAPLLISVLVLLGLMASLGVGCGGGSSTSSDSSGTTANSNSTEGSVEGGSGSKGEEGQAEGGADFRVPGGEKQEVNRIIAGSREASPEEVAAASRALDESLEARANRDWSGQCDTLSKKMVQVVEESGTVVEANPSCSKNLSQAGEKAPPRALTNNFSGSIGALRLVGSKQAFAFYHGTDGKDYLIPMEEESDGEWKVASLTPEALPSS